jgi:hypothetical protein
MHDEDENGETDNRVVGQRQRIDLQRDGRRLNYENH